MHWKVRGRKEGLLDIEVIHSLLLQPHPFSPTNYRLQKGYFSFPFFLAIGRHALAAGLRMNVLEILNYYTARKAYAKKVKIGSGTVHENFKKPQPKSGVDST